MDLGLEGAAAVVTGGSKGIGRATALCLAALIYHRTQSRFASFYETSVFLPHVVSLVPAAFAWKSDRG